MSFKQWTAAVVLVVAAAVTASAQDASFTVIDVWGGSATDVTGDGTIVAGNTGYYGSCFTWTEAGGIVDIGGNAGMVTISDDGSAVSAILEDLGLQYAGLWLGGTSWQNLGGIGGQSGTSVSTNYGISGDGSTVTGLAWVDAGTAHAFSWTQATGMVDLGSLGGESSRANGISADGSTIVGWDQDPNTGWWRGVRWVNGVESLLDPNGWGGNAFGVNSDGTIIVGGGYPTNSEHAYLWTEADGFTDLGMLSGWMSLAEARDVSDDGSVVVGFSGGFMDYNAFIWTESTGMVKLYDYLTDLGVTTHQGWTVAYANAVSDDGTVIVGSVQDASWNLYPFVATIPSLNQLEADVNEISAATGGTVSFSMNAGTSNASRDYFLCGSVSGTDPGYLLPGGLTTLPLNRDFFSDYIFNNMNNTNFIDFAGTLDASGLGTATLDTLGPVTPILPVGTTMHFAFTLRSPFNFVSNAVAVEIIP